MFSYQRPFTLLTFLLGWLSLFPIPAAPYELTGRVSSDLYSYKDIDDNHLRPYLRFRGNLLAWQSKSGRSLNFRTSLRWVSDFADQLPSDPQLFVYETFAFMKGLPLQTDIYLGRQFVYTGVGSALMDGGRIHFRRNKNVSLNIFGGSSVSSEDPETIRSPEDFLIVGGRLSARPDKKTRLGLNWILKRRNGSRSTHRIGLDAGRLIGPTENFGRVAYNEIDRRLSEILARSTFRKGKWHLSGEYHQREPFVASNSIFSLIDFKRYRIGRIEVRRRVWRDISILSHVQADFTSSDDTWRTGFGLSMPRLSLSWIHQSGYAGDNDGISAFTNIRLNEQLDGYVSANLFRYRVQLEQMERSDAYASTVGVRWSPGWGMSVLAEGQYLRNAVFKNDTRLLLRISKDFSIKSMKG